jgi:hypothetical protein
VFLVADMYHDSSSKGIVNLEITGANFTLPSGSVNIHIDDLMQIYSLKNSKKSRFITS